MLTQVVVHGVVVALAQLSPDMSPFAAEGQPFYLRMGYHHWEPYVETEDRGRTWGE